MQGCKYNTKEFAPFTSGGKRIKPALADDWKVTTGGFRNSNDVLNLTSATLNQTVYDISSSHFFKFMKEENVTMKGNDIEGSYAIGTQRVLRKETDYLATMSKISERKETVIAKKDMILGHEYETVCGSTFIFAGTRYFIKATENKSGVRLTKNKKYYLSYSKGYYTNIQDVTAKKVVKDHGLKQDKKFLDDEIEKYIRKNKILFNSETLESPKFQLQWLNTNVNITERYGRGGRYDYLMHNNGLVYIKNDSKNRYGYKVEFKLLQEEAEYVWKPIDEFLRYDTYDNNSKLLADYRTVKPNWVLII